MNINYYLKDRLRLQEQWLKDFIIWNKHEEIIAKAAKAYYKKKPILSLLLKIYFLPTNFCNFVSRLRDMHIYNMCKKEVEVLKKEIEETNK